MNVGSERKVQAHRDRDDDPWLVIGRLYRRIAETERNAPYRCCWIDRSENDFRMCGEIVDAELLIAADTRTVGAISRALRDLEYRPHVPLCNDHAAQLAERIDVVLDAHVDALMHRRAHDRADNAAVYYLRRESDGMIKIGYSSRLNDRMVTLRAAHGALTLLAVENGGRPMEARRHQQWAAARVDGEFFRPTPEILAHIEELRLDICQVEGPAANAFL